MSARRLLIRPGLAALVAALLVPALPASSAAPESGGPTGTPVATTRTFDYALTPRLVAPGVYAFVGHTEDFTPVNGGNIVNTGFIVGREGIVVIDTGSSRRYGEQMLAAIRRVSDKPIVLALNTHLHPDHFLGNQVFPRTALGALEKTRRGIQKDGEAFNENLYRLTGDWMKGTERVAPAHAIEPGRRTVAGRDLEFLAFAGHTEADLVVIDHATGTVFAGDLLFHDRAPTTPHADIASWLAALDQLETLPAKHWVPGHGPVSDDLIPLRQTRAWLRWLQRTINEGAESGLDMSEMLARPVPGEFAHLAEAGREYRRSVVHLFPAAERATLEAPHAK